MGGRGLREIFCVFVIDVINFLEIEFLVSIVDI